jgi:putative membrane protein
MVEPLSEDERKRIEAAIGALERRTSAELAVVVARRSHDYASHPFLWAALAAFAAGIAAALASTELWPMLTGVDVVLIEGVVFALVWLLLHFTGLGIALVPDALKQRHVNRAARAEFASLVAQQTEGLNGMLLYVSLAERTVVILVDRAIKARIPAETWAAIVARFRESDRPLVERVLAAIEDCAAALAPHFPPVPGQKDEIPNRVEER